MATQYFNVLLGYPNLMATIIPVKQSTRPFYYQQHPIKHRQAHPIFLHNYPSHHPQSKDSFPQNSTGKQLPFL